MFQEIKPKDIIQYILYIVTLTVFAMKISNTVDNVSIAVTDLKQERKEFAQKGDLNYQLIQGDIKALSIRAELNRQNIEVIKSDLEILRLEIDKK